MLHGLVWYNTNMTAVSKHTTFIVSVFLIWLVLLQVVGFTATHVRADEIQDPWEAYEFQHVPYFARWDSGWYASVAQGGYVLEEGKSNLAFFPLYPLLIRAVHTALPINYFWLGQIIALIAVIIGMCVWYRLARLDYSEQRSKLSLLYLIAFPTSFFLISVYSESVFLLLLLLSFYFARKQKWLYAVLCAGLLTATRVVGIFIIPALLFEYLAQKDFKFQNIKKDAGLLLLIPLPFLAFLLFSHLRFGNALAPFLAQQEFARQVTLIPVHVWSYLHDTLDVAGTVMKKQFYIFYDLAALVVFLFLIIWAWVKQAVRRSYLVFAIFALLLPVFSGTLTSLSRYVLVLFPAFFALASFQNRYFKIIYFIIAIPLLLTAAYQFVRWQWVA